jgi:predicted ATPase/DNA-binding CsgD family transcriptional regulator
MSMKPTPQSPEQADLSTSLPVYLTRFVGREQERATLASLLLNKRLLTLIGAGGIGKTRLALEVATTLSTSFLDGVYMVELATLSDPHMVPQAIASVLGIRTDRESALSSLLIAALKERHILLLLDNCEHVLTECAPLVEALLHACPQLHLLATSREPLEVAGETVWRVKVLPTPEPSELPAIELLARYEAIQLFCERATESVPHFRLTSHNASAIASICHQLDGLPLALELATALLPMLSVDQLAARLNERFALLTQGKRTAATRHLSLQATLDWSYTLLTPAEQDLFSHLAVFAGDFDLDAVEQICAPAEAKPLAIFGALARLVNTSLVVAEEREESEHGAVEVRYRLLDTMHQYALEKLQQTGDWQQACEQHYTWYLCVAKRASEHLHGAEHALWLDRLEMEMPNMRVALTRALNEKHLDAAARLADTLLRFWITHNHFSEGRYWFDTLLTVESEGGRLSPQLRARVLFGGAEFARYQGAHDRAYTLLEELMQQQQALDDAFGLAEAQTYLGLAVGLRGDYERANTLCQTSLAFYRQEGHRPGITSTLTTLAFITLAQGHYSRAVDLSEEACQLLRNTGNQVHLLYALFTLAQAALLQECSEQARAACQEALHLARSQEQTYGIAASLGLIGGLAGLEGDLVQAARLFGGAQALQTRVQVSHPPAGRALQERMVLSIRATLGKEQFISHYSAGQACSLEQILLEAENVLQPAPGSISFPSPSLSLALARLSPREREVLSLVATGLTDAQVATSLQLSPRTVSKHMQSIYTKLNINSRGAATHFALEHGLV